MGNSLAGCLQQKQSASIVTFIWQNSIPFKTAELKVCHCAIHTTILLYLEAPTTQKADATAGLLSKISKQVLTY